MVTPGSLAGYGEMGALIQSKDWSATIGPLEKWPKSLQTVVQLMLGSRYAIWIGWGPELAFLYNDAYAKMTLGQKHPWALGRAAREVWAEAWEDLGPRVEEVVRQGQATYDEDLQLLLTRSGYSEETYHTFSYSPLPDDNGAIGGLLCIVVEDTQRFIAARRLAVIRETAAQTANARSLDDLFGAITRSLSTDRHDLPFTLIYLIEEGGERARLRSRMGFNENHPAAPEIIEVGASGAAWPIGEVMERRATAIIENLAERFTDLPRGAWAVSPQRAVAVPLARQGQESPAGVLIAGLNPHRPFNDVHVGFINLLAGQIAAGLADVRAYEEERRRAEALAELDRAKMAFFSNVSHELRTPLTLMLGPLDELIRGMSDSDKVTAKRGDIELVYRNGMRLLRLVNTLLDFSRIEAGRLQPVFEATDLASYTAELASSFQSAIERAGLRYLVDCIPLEESVYVDREMWEKIVLNLLSNAFKYTLQGEIAISLRRSSDGKSARLTVRDTGAGIPENELPRLFERFHRIERQAGRSQEGSGIGLALVQELARLQSGSIEVESAPGKGSAFTITMPLGTAHLPAEFSNGREVSMPARTRTGLLRGEPSMWLAAEPLNDGAINPAGEAGVAMNDGRPRPRVLVADDNADMRGYLGRLLEPSYRVETVADGKAAFAAARRQRPDLILSDVMMPVMDGFVLLQALRGDRELRDVPVILLSARAGEEASLEGLEAGAADYLVKPFSARELLVRVRNNLEMAKMQREAGRIENELRREIQAAQELAEAILASINDGFFDLDRDWRITFVNAAALRFMEHTLEDLIGKVYWEQFPAIAGTETERHLRRSMAERTTAVFEMYYAPWETWVDVRLYPSRTGGLSIYFQDITQRKLAEESLRHLNDTLEKQVTERTAELQAKELRLRTIFETSYSFQGLLELDGTLIDANATSLESIGLSLNQVKGRPMWELPWFTGTPGVSEKVRNAIARAAAGELVRQEIHVNLPVGGWRWFDFVLRPVRNEKGEVTSIMPEAVELTARRQAEEALRQAHKMEAIGQLTGGVAHDFNNLLQVIVGNLHLLERRVARGDAPQSDLQRLIEGATRGARRAATLTQRLLAFSRRQPLDPKPLEVNRLVTRMSELLHRTLGENINIETVLAGGLWRIFSDAAELENALLNLAVNARDAMADGGRLTIETANAYIDDAYAAAQEELAPGQYVMIAVSDTGTGMTQEVIAKAFEPFFTTKDSGHGTGLGLSQVYGFVKQSGGHVKIYSELNEGSTVKIYMPRFADESTPARERAARLPLIAGSEREIILVVEDDEDVRANTIAMLRELGYGILEAPDGFSALETLEAGSLVDLLFTDVGLPGGVNGRQLADQARQLRPRLKVLFTSGYARNAIVHQGRLDAGVELIAKPFTLSQLAAKIHQMLKASA